MKEGNKNEPLCHHPANAESYWAYMIINHPAYYITEVIVCVLLLLLAFLEKPALFDVPVQVSIFHAHISLYNYVDMNVHT